MKNKTILFLVFVLSFLLLCACGSSSSAIGAVWEKKFYTDKFGDKTEEYYLTNRNHFSGTYNKESVNDGKLAADIAVERDGELVQTYIFLYENENEQIKNSGILDNYYDITVKRTDGSQFSLNGVMLHGSDKISFSSSVELPVALSSTGIISIYIEDHNQPINNYLFKANCGNFGELFNDEIIVPYNEEKYNEAEVLLNNKQFDEAEVIFSRLGDFKDSPARVEETIEARNRDTYSKAETHIKNKEYGDAIAVFKSLGDYADSKEKVESTFSIAVEYAQSLAEDKKYDDALSIFETIKQYGNVSDEVLEVRYKKACSMMEKEEYASALDIFEEIGSYKDIATLVDECRSGITVQTYNEGKSLMNKGEYQKATTVFESISDYKDSKNLAKQCVWKFLDGNTEMSDLGFAERFFWRNCDQYQKMSADKIRTMLLKYDHWLLNGFKSYWIKQNVDGVGLDKNCYGSDSDFKKIYFENDEYVEHWYNSSARKHGSTAYDWYQLSDKCFLLVNKSTDNGDIWVCD